MRRSGDRGWNGEGDVTDEERRKKEKKKEKDEEELR